MGGGPSPEQSAAAASQAHLTDLLGTAAQSRDAREAGQYKQIAPYATSRLNGGLPFFPNMTDYTAGNNARAFAPGRAALMRSFGRTSALPNGFKTGALADYDAARARGFDAGLMGDQLTNEQAKSEAARLITGQQAIANPLGYYQAAMGGNQSIMQAPLQRPGLAGLFGGIASGAASAIPF